jgi:predicted dehydrogenase
MKKIGFIDLDTSHPRSFVKRINAMDSFKVTGVFDRSRVKGSKETVDFSEEFGARVFDSPSKLAEACDGVMVLSADWETHFSDISIVLNAGKACYCDKPLVGSLQELNALAEIAEKSEAPFLAGSGWRWNDVVSKIAKDIEGKRISDALFCAPSDRFYYGIHGVEFILGIFGPGIESVKVEAKTEQATIVSLRHKRGMTISLILETDFSLSRFNVFSVDGQRRSITLDGDDVHNGICENFAKCLLTGRSPATFATYAESVKIMLAIERSLISGNVERPSDLEPSFSVSSADFMRSYQ